MSTASSGRRFGSLVANDLAALGGPGGVQPYTGGRWRVTGLGGKLCITPIGDGRFRERLVGEGRAGYELGATHDDASVRLLDDSVRIEDHALANRFVVVGMILDREEQLRYGLTETAAGEM